jgi:cation-transporting ATPase E
MESGSNVTRNVADMILLNDLRALLPALTEGKRIIGGLSISLYLFLARVSMLLIIAIVWSASASRMSRRRLP